MAYWPTKFRTSSSQAEGAEREFACATLGIEGRNGRVTGVKCAALMPSASPFGNRIRAAGRSRLPCHRLRPSRGGRSVGAERAALDKRGNVAADEETYLTSTPKLYAAGDMRRGQSLVVWAIREGRQAAHAIDKDLMGATTLPR